MVRDKPDLASPSKKPRSERKKNIDNTKFNEVDEVGNIHRESSVCVVS